jgi:hypothetical protein
MPLIDITCAPAVSDATKRALANEIPEIVSNAVECEAEPFDGSLQVGDVIVRFRSVGSLDRFDLDVLVEVHSKWFQDRAQSRQERAAAVLAGVEGVVAPHSVGVYLSLPVAAWDQSG